MSIAELTGLLDVLAWPIVILVVAVSFRRELGDLFGRVREIEAPGDVKITLDAHKVEEIIAEGQEKNASAAALADRIVRSAIVLDKREARILRALLDDEGRHLYNYQSDYYRPALSSLMSRGLVAQRGDKGFALTAEGSRVTKQYLSSVLEPQAGTSVNATVR